jgi:hypothetical protein
MVQTEAHWEYPGAFDTLTPHGPSRRFCDSLLTGFGFLTVDAFADNARKNDLPGCGIHLPTLHHSLITFFSMLPPIILKA